MCTFDELIPPKPKASYLVEVKNAGSSSQNEKKVEKQEDSVDYKKWLRIPPTTIKSAFRRIKEETEKRNDQLLSLAIAMENSLSLGSFSLV